MCRPTRETSFDGPLVEALWINHCSDLIAGLL
jgi:hypothetical protein